MGTRAVSRAQGAIGLNVTKVVDLATSAAQLEAEEVLERTINERRRVMPYLEAAFGPRMRREYVVVLRRP